MFLIASTVTQQFDIAVSILGVSAHRLQAVQSSSLGPDMNLNCKFTTQYWLLRVRLVRLPFALYTIRRN